MDPATIRFLTAPSIKKYIDNQIDRICEKYNIERTFDNINDELDCWCDIDEQKFYDAYDELVENVKDEYQLKQGDLLHLGGESNLVLYTFKSKDGSINTKLHSTPSDVYPLYIFTDIYHPDMEFAKKARDIIKRNFDMESNMWYMENGHVKQVFFD